MNIERMREEMKELRRNERECVRLMGEALNKKRPDYSEMECLAIDLIDYGEKWGKLAVAVNALESGVPEEEVDV